MENEKAVLLGFIEYHVSMEAFRAKAGEAGCPVDFQPHASNSWSSSTISVHDAVEPQAETSRRDSVVSAHF